MVSYLDLICLGIPVWIFLGIAGFLLVFAGVQRRNNREFSLGLILFGVSLALTCFVGASLIGWDMEELSGKQESARLLLNIVGGMGAGIAVLGLASTLSKALFFKGQAKHKEYQPSESASEKPSECKLLARSNWKTIVTSILVVVVVSLVLNVVIYTQPLSKLKVIVVSDYLQLTVEVRVYLDGELKTVTVFGGGATTAGEWQVNMGSHSVALDHGTWDGEWSGGEWSHYADGYRGPDGILDYEDEFRVGTLDSVDVYVHIFLPQ